MSRLSVSITNQAPADYYSAGTVLSVNGQTAQIHLVDSENNLSHIKKAARILDSLGVMQVELIGRHVVKLLICCLTRQFDLGCIQICSYTS